MSRVLHFFLIAISTAWLGLLLALPALAGELAAFRATLLLLVVNAAASLWVLTTERRVLVAINVVQIVLFGVLSAELATAFGEEHYRFTRTDIHWYDWAEFTAAHVVKAADVLDGLDEYGIEMHAINPQSTAAAIILACLHVSVDIFLVSLLLKGLRRWWKREGPRETLLQRERRVFGWLLAAMVLYVIFGVAVGLSPRDWMLWPLDNVLRVLDIAGLFALFGWQLHGVEVSGWTRAAALVFRFAVGFWMARTLLHLRATRFAAWGLDIEEVTELLDDDESAVRRGAADGLGTSGADADSAVAELIERLAHDPDCEVRASAAQALGRIVPTLRDPRVVADAVDTLTEAIFNASRPVRLRAAQALAAIGPPARAAFESLVWVQRLCPEDEEVTTAARGAVASIARSFPGSAWEGAER